jgi:hypothetical protein
VRGGGDKWKEKKMKIVFIMIGMHKREANGIILQCTLTSRYKRTINLNIVHCHLEI